MDGELLLRRPVEALAAFREKAFGECSTWSDDGDAETRRAVTETLWSAEGPTLLLERIPFLSRQDLRLGRLPANSLVRYRGMVQDVCSPELFVGRAERVDNVTGCRTPSLALLYMDCVPEVPGVSYDFDGPAAVTMERLPLCCVPIPGQSPWAQHALRNNVAAAVMDPPASQPPSLSKRLREQSARPSETGEADDRLKAAFVLDNGPACGDGSRCRQRARPDSEAANLAGPAKLVAGIAVLPFASEQEAEELACVVKVYGAGAGDFKLNDTVEFVGVLTTDTRAAAGGSAGPEGCDGGGSDAPRLLGDPFAELEAFSQQLPPPSIAPRLHCLAHRRIAAVAPLPVDAASPRAILLNAAAAVAAPAAVSGAAATPSGSLAAFAGRARAAAVARLSAALGGDDLAAEYVLLALLSRAYARTPMLALGCLSVALTGAGGNVSAVTAAAAAASTAARGAAATAAVTEAAAAAATANALHAAMAALVPKCVRLRVETASLSHPFAFAPRKNYERDRLAPSALQLSTGTAVLVDETRLTSGPITADGLRNLAALRSLLLMQKVPYDFRFYSVDFEADAPAVVVARDGTLSEARVRVPLRPSAVSGGDGGDDDDVPADEANHGAAAVVASDLDLVRLYIAASRLSELDMDAETAVFAEEDYVQSRQADTTVKAEDFHLWLTLSRLLALSMGDTHLRQEHWQRARALESRRRERCAALLSATASARGSALTGPRSPSSVAAFAS